MRNDDKTTEYNREYDHDRSISQDKTEYLAKQSELINDAYDPIIYDYVHNDNENANVNKHSDINNPLSNEYLNGSISRDDYNSKPVIAVDNNSKESDNLQIQNESKQNVSIHQQPEGERSGSQDAQRKEIISILRDNSKALLQSDQSTNFNKAQLQGESNPQSQYMNNAKEHSAGQKQRHKIIDFKGPKARVKRVSEFKYYNCSHKTNKL